MKKLATLQENRGILWALAATILVLNLYDAMVTLAVVESGLAEEANPLMRTPLAWGALEFMAVKLGLVSTGVLLLWRLRQVRIAAIGMASLAGVYLCLGAYHMRSLSVLAEFIG